MSAQAKAAEKLTRLMNMDTRFDMAASTEFEFHGLKVHVSKSSGIDPQVELGILRSGVEKALKFEGDEPRSHLRDALSEIDKRRADGEEG